jgi:hypothetical protein
MTFTDELMAKRRCDMSMSESMTWLWPQKPILTSRHVTTSYKSGMILTDWQRMNKTEMDTKTIPKLASRLCRVVISIWSLFGREGDPPKCCWCCCNDRINWLLEDIPAPLLATSNRVEAAAKGPYELCVGVSAA